MSEKEDETFDLCCSSANAGSLRFPLCIFPQRQLALQIAAGLTLANQQGSFRSAASSCLCTLWVSGAHYVGFQNLRGTMQVISLSTMVATSHMQLLKSKLIKNSIKLLSS